MSENRRLALRILYTINSSPQYILARSASAVQVRLVSSPNLQLISNDHPIQYATASLKTCLDVICRSSPELIQNGVHDCAVYVLDPLEANSAPPIVPILSSQLTPKEPSVNVSRGVAVGLGLMSRGLGHEGNKVSVPGTLITVGPGQDALEIVLALREMIPTTTVPPSKSEYNHLGFQNKRARVELTPAASTSANVDASLQISKPTYSDADKITLSKTTIHLSSGSKPHGTKPRYLCNLEREKFLGVSDTYVRPLQRNSNPELDGAAGDITASYGTDRARDMAALDLSFGQQAPSSANDSSSPGTRIPSPDSIVLGLRALVDNPSSSISNSQNTSLLALLSAIDTPCPPNEPNPVLLGALKQLLSTLSQSPQHPGNSDPPNSRKNSPEDDPDIVLLDKENVNPASFRHQKGGGLQGAIKPLGTAPQPNASGPGIRETQNFNQNMQSNENQPPLSNPVRKRTLSDLMDEKEAVRTLRKGRRGLGRQRKPTSSATDSSSSGLRHYTHSVRYDDHSRERTTMMATTSYYRTAIDSWSSPVRPRELSSRENPIVISDSPEAPKVSASSPVKPTTIPLHPPRRYVVPEWARTSTSTRPRLSEEAQRAKEHEEKGRQDITHRKPPGSEPVKEKTMKKATRKPAPARGSYKLMAAPPSCVSKSIPSEPPQPVAACDCSLFPSSSTVGDEATTVRFPPPTDPCTPPRKRQSSRAGTSLFTPTPSSWSGLKGLTSSPLFSPPQIEDSPTKGKTTSTCSSARKRILIEEADGDAEESEDEALAQELDSALQDLGFIPNSLPLTSSDARDTPSTSTPDEGPSPSEGPASRQHWSGLPPSSPPPPSSPLNLPQELRPFESELSTEDDGDDVELPVATSDAYPETNTYTLNSDNTSATFPSGLTAYLDNPEFQSLFLSLPGSPHTQPDETYSMDIFQQFTNHNVQSDGPQESDPMLKALNPSLDAALQNGLGDFDLTEFWETFKPMAGTDLSKYSNPEQLLNADDLEVMLGPAGDHAQLAESIQALFSGCLM